MNDFMIKEMSILRQYCSLIHKERERNGFNSLKYPLISVKLNRYFLPEFRHLIAVECNLVGTCGIEPVQYDEDEVNYELSNTLKVKLDITKSQWQEELYQERVERRKQIEEKINKEI